MAAPIKPERVLDVALEIADREGLEKLSMRRIGSRLGVSAMALYRHVADKDQLLAQMTDRALGTLSPPDLSGDWGAELERFFLAVYDLAIAHPAVAELLMRQPINGPVATRLGNGILELLIASDFSDDAAVDALVNLFVYTVGASLYNLSRRPVPVSRAPEPGPTAYRLRASLNEAGTRPRFERNLRGVIAGLAVDARF